jgi:hypothetical protein
MVRRWHRPGTRAGLHLALVRLGWGVLRSLLLPRLLQRSGRPSGLLRLPARYWRGWTTSSGKLALLRRSSGLLPLCAELQSPMADCPGCSWCGPGRAAVSTLNSGADNTNSAYCSFCGAVEWACWGRPRGCYRLPKANTRVTPFGTGRDAVDSMARRGDRLQWVAASPVRYAGSQTSVPLVRRC